MPLSSNGTLSDVESDVEVRPKEVREQLERIYSSHNFERSRRLKDFLTFITDLTLEGRGEEINEHLIGIEVFERGAGYDPSGDSVVRRQAHSLRRKLEAYYASEGKHDPVEVQVPLGHYVPAFRHRRTTAEVDDFKSATPAPTALGAKRPWLVGVALLALAVLAFFAGRASSLKPASAHAVAQGIQPTAIGELWGPWFDVEAGPLICLSSPLTGVIKHFEQPLPPEARPRRLKLTGGLAEEFLEFYGFVGGHLYISPSVTEAKSGEALGAIHLANLFSANGLAARGTSSLLLNWDSFKRENIILLGHSEQNQWVAPLLKDYPLQLRQTRGGDQRRIINLEPQPGESQEFHIDYSEDPLEPTVEYALVSMLPGLDARRQLLLVSGLNTQATLMGIEFLTDPERAESLLSIMREKDPQHRGPWRFQLILRAEVHGKVPTGGSVELIRVIN